MLREEIVGIIDAASERLKIVLGQEEKTALIMVVDQAFRLAPHPVDGAWAIEIIRGFLPVVEKAFGAAESADHLAGAMKKERVSVWPQCCAYLLGPLIGLKMALNGQGVAGSGRHDATNVFSMIGYAIRRQQPVRR